MSEFISLVIVIGCAAMPFIAMPLLWRRMKQVRDLSYRDTLPLRRVQPWEETVNTENGMNLGRSGSTNDDLIELGSKARQSRWPIDNH